MRLIVLGFPTPLLASPLRGRGTTSNISARRFAAWSVKVREDLGWVKETQVRAPRQSRSAMRLRNWRVEARHQSGVHKIR